MQERLLRVLNYRGNVHLFRWSMTAGRSMIEIADSLDLTLRSLSRENGKGGLPTDLRCNRLAPELTGMHKVSASF